MVTRPGINPGFEMENYPPNEQRIIRKFSDGFYVTRSMKAIIVGNASYRAFLMRPSELLSIAMNIDREIVVLFANYENFEARTLRAFDDVYAQFRGDSRIDSSLRFIVSGDINIDAIIRNFLNQNPDYPIVVPYRYDEISAADSQSIFGKIRSNHLIRDLFGFQSPLKNEYFFFGRDRLVNDVIDFHKSGQNCGIFGLRKSGKTSTIYAIQRRIKTAGSVVVVLDCQDTSVHARRYGDLLSHIVTEVGRSIGAKSERFDFGESPANISDKFKDLMLRYMSQCKSNILIIFDEIENISPQTASSSHWKSGTDALYFWQILRSFFQSEKKYNISFCFVGTNPGLLEQPKLVDSPNPIYLFAKKIFIPNLHEDDTFRMVSRLGYFMGMDFPRAVSDHLHRRFGGHPFFIRQICSKIHYTLGLNRPITVSIKSCKDAEVSSSGEIKRYVGEIISSLKEFYPNEFDMLEYLAAGRESDFYDMVGSYPEFVEHLVGYGLLAPRGPHFDFEFEFVREVFVESFSTKPKMKLDEMRSEISRRRNLIEESIRVFLYWETYRYTQEEWARLISNTINIDRHGLVPNARITFSKRGSPLYIVDLIRIIKFLNLEIAGFQMSELLNALNAINSYRIDAHAKNISIDEFEALLDKMSVLECAFSAPE